MTTLAAHPWSSQQSDIFDWFKTHKQHVLVRARAGTGKTTTILEGIRHAPGYQSILLAAFNAHIAKELKDRVLHPQAEARTLHSAGFQIVRQRWPGVRVENDEERYHRQRHLAKAALHELFHAPQPAPRPGQPLPPRKYDADDLDQVDTFEVERGISTLHTKVREMAPHIESMSEDERTHLLNELAFRFDCVPEELGPFADELIWDAAFEAVKLARQRPADGLIDFTDMIFLPVANGWVRPRFETVVIDEAQDMNATQLELALGLAIQRVCLVGDNLQAIYGFRGADSGSLDRLKKELQAEELGLTTTYRCPKLVVAEAQTYAADLEAAPSAPDGEVLECLEGELVNQLDPDRGDAVLSRTNAPLVPLCLECLRRGMPAYVVGKDIGDQLQRLLDRVTKGLGCVDLGRFMELLSVWHRKQLDRLGKSGLDPDALAVKSGIIGDQVETLRSLCEDLDDTDQLRDRIDQLFDKVRRGRRITFSTVHKAKGLEWNRVHLLRWTFRENAGGEEANICYVGITRAKKALVWVGETWEERKKRQREERENVHAAQ